MLRTLIFPPRKLHLTLAKLVLLCWVASPLKNAQAGFQPQAFFPRVNRGAYLQSGSSTGMVVRWRTIVATTSLVRFGPAPREWTDRAGSPGHTKEHVVLLSGLKPGTKYFYAIGTSNQVLQSGPLNYFVTAPGPSTTSPIRVWVLGDPGTGNATQKAVRDAYVRTSGAVSTDLILTLGDNAYPSGTDVQYQDNFFEVYRDQLKSAVLWPALGNHDTRNADWKTESGVYYDIFTLPRAGQCGGAPSGTESYYSFDYGPVHFICLNSDAIESMAPMTTWLRQDLATRRAPWTIAYWHHPPYSKGSHDSDEERNHDPRMGIVREQIVPMVEAAGVDLVLCGHSHLYERSFRLHGHYGRSASFAADMIFERGDGRLAGDGPYVKRPGASATVYVNAGSSGHATKAKDLHGLNHPAMLTALNVPGSLVLEITPSELNASFLDEHGHERDSFTIRAQGAEAGGAGTIFNR